MTDETALLKRNEEISMSIMSTWFITFSWVFHVSDIDYDPRL